MAADQTVKEEIISKIYLNTLNVLSTDSNRSEQLSKLLSDPTYTNIVEHFISSRNALRINSEPIQIAVTEKKEKLEISGHFDEDDP